MTNQEAFDTMVRHLRKQGRKSENDQKDYCLYRGPEGLKCAVGVLIPDSEYQKKWDEAGIRVNELGHCQSLNGLDLTMLEKMQFAHDCASVDSWEICFERIAARYHLSMPPLENVVPA